MRILFTAVPAYGHLHPLVPLARALAARGHEVRVATGASLLPAVERAGLRGVACGNDGADAPRSVTDRGALGLFGSWFGPPMLRDLRRLADAWRPDLVVREDLELAAPVLAEALGVPCATLCMSVLHPPPFRAALAAALREALAGEPDAPAVDDVLYARGPRLAWLPPAWFGEAVEGVRCYRVEPFDRSGDEGLPAGLSERPRGRPRVHATLGTVFTAPGLLRAILDGLAGEDLDLVLTVGRRTDPASLGPLPANAVVERYIPHGLLLPHCDALVAHGGFNTLLAGLRHALPMAFVRIPHGAGDQEPAARRAEALGFGRLAEGVPPSAEAIRAAVRAVLDDPSYADASRRMRDALDALPPVEAAAADLERRVAAG